MCSPEAFQALNVTENPLEGRWAPLPHFCFPLTPWGLGRAPGGATLRIRELHGGRGGVLAEPGPLRGMCLQSSFSL